MNIIDSDKMAAHLITERDYVRTSEVIGPPKSHYE